MIWTFFLCRSYFSISISLCFTPIGPITSEFLCDSSHFSHLSKWQDFSAFNVVYLLERAAISINWIQVSVGKISWNDTKKIYNSLKIVSHGKLQMVICGQIHSWFVFVYTGNQLHMLKWMRLMSMKIWRSTNTRYMIYSPTDRDGHTVCLYLHTESNKIMCRNDMIPILYYT